MDMIQDYPGFVVLGAIVLSWLFAAWGQRHL